MSATRSFSETGTTPRMHQLLSFEGKVVLVTGGAQGIGLETARLFHELGGKVCIIDVDDSKLQDALKLLSNGEDAAMGWNVGIRSREQLAKVAENIEKQLGGLDVLVNCAAIAGAQQIMGKFAETTPEFWQPLIDVNLIGTLNVTQALLPLLVARGKGAIVNVVSDSYKGLDYKLAVYSAGKAGVAAFTKALSREVGPQGIRVNGVSPSATKTRSSTALLGEGSERLLKSYPLRRFGEPADQGQAIVFLASDAASWITGQILSVNGGYN